MNDARLDRLQARVLVLEAQEGLLAAEFLDTADSVEDKLTVRIFGYDQGEHVFGSPGGVVWQPRLDENGDAVLPSSGDTAYVIEASDGRWIVVAWTPAQT